MNTSTLPTLYEYYTAGGILNGLTAENSVFQMNGRNITIYSGSLHYFRVPREYWRDRLRKMRAAGLNTVDTYIPWNLHEPQENYFDFGNGGSDYERFLNCAEFFKIAQEEDLFVIARPGPYICAETDFGGLPSWLLREKEIRLRSSQKTYMEKVSKYFSVLLPILAALQFTRGGPIIAFQVENEFGGYAFFNRDDQYLEALRNLMLNHGIVELLLTSDPTVFTGNFGTLGQYFLQTSNFASYPAIYFFILGLLQRNKPYMAMEFYAGWFDYWGASHATRNEEDYYNNLEMVLQYPASVNMYMFVGGTSFSFLNGGNILSLFNDNNFYKPVTTSYDYDAPISENGDYTRKYFMTKFLLDKYSKIKFKLPVMPILYPSRIYNDILKFDGLTYHEMINHIPIKEKSRNVKYMELLDINNNSGQSYGYIIYRKENILMQPNALLEINGDVKDDFMILINNKTINNGMLRKFDNIRLSNSYLKNAVVDILVENMGRIHFGFANQFYQYKGISGSIYIDYEKIENWNIIPLEFKSKWTSKLTGWHDITSSSDEPTLYRFKFYPLDNFQDTYLDMSEWTKGIVIVNNFVLGRYDQRGPQQALYLPAPFINKGENTIIILEFFKPGKKLSFASNIIYKSNSIKI